MIRIQSRIIRFSSGFFFSVMLMVFALGAEAVAQGLPGRVVRSRGQAVSPRRAPAQGQVQAQGQGQGIVQQGYTGAMIGSPWMIPGWGWTLPQTYRRGAYFSTGAVDPRLGLQYNYPYAWQLGIQMPVDASPLDISGLGPFEGVVRSQQRPGRLNSAAARNAVALLRRGKYRDAGLLMADAYRASDDPIHPLLLAEALFGLGKYQHAELVLRKAIEAEGASRVLPEDVAGHFPSAKAFEERLADLVKTGKHQLLTAYMSLFAADGSSGIAGLLALEKTDDLAGKLYRHYLDRVFGPEEDGGEAPAEGKAQ